MITGNPLICPHCGGQVVVKTIKRIEPQSKSRNFRHFSEEYTPTVNKIVARDEFVCEDCGKVVT